VDEDTTKEKIFNSYFYFESLSLKARLPTCADVHPKALELLKDDNQIEVWDKQFMKYGG
jgi:hypothetical protein